MAKRKTNQEKKRTQASANARKAPKAASKRKSSAKGHSKQSTQLVAQLKKQVTQLKKKNDALDDHYLRAEAEMQNVQRHAATDQAQIRKYSGQKLAQSILPGLDNLKRAMSVKVTDKNGKQLKQGVQMVYNRLNHALAQNHIKPVDVLGKPFNPEVAQAVQTVKADKKHPADSVVRVLQNGYKIHDRTLRPAMVIVAK